jgi:uncharacterized protein (TIGR03435 family)
MRSLASRQILVGLAGVLALAQAPAAPEFEVATVKSSPPPAGDLININIGGFRNGKLTFANASLSDCLKFAWGIVSDEQIAGPDWIKSKGVRFDIVAQTAPGTPREQLELMLQTLLADRLKLAIHHEQKQLSFLALIPGKNGAKLQAANSESAASGNNPSSRGHIASKYMSMKVLATLLSRFEREIVVDQTGMAGPFEVKLDWSPDDGIAPAGNAANDVPSGPSIYTALQEQLGLKLESRKGPLDVLVVDHAEKVPNEN